MRVWIAHGIIEPECFIIRKTSQRWTASFYFRNASNVVRKSFDRSTSDYDRVVNKLEVLGIKIPMEMGEKNTDRLISLDNGDYIVETKSGSRYENRRFIVSKETYFGPKMAEIWLYLRSDFGLDEIKKNS